MDYIQKTTQEKAVDQLTAIQRIKNQAINSLATSSKLGYDNFWFMGEHPNEKAKRLGTSAMQVFKDHGETEAFIKSKKPEYEMLGIPEKFSVTWELKRDEEGNMIIENGHPIPTGACTITDVVIEEVIPEVVVPEEIIEG